VKTRGPIEASLVRGSTERVFQSPRVKTRGPIEASQ